MTKKQFTSPYARKEMRIVFLGTPDFAVPCLDMLVEEEYNVVGVFTQPDRPVGRSAQLKYSAVKECALKHLLPVFQVEKIRLSEGSQLLKDLNPDLMVTAAFGQILSKENLETPTIGCINVHGSLLPKYRGAAPIQWAIIDGEKETGITTMLTDIGIDTGDILKQYKMPISETETAGVLFERMALEGAHALKDTLAHLIAGDLTREEQDEAAATHCKMLKKEDGFIDWMRSAMQISNQIRGMNPWPCAFTTLNDEVFKIWASKVTESHGLQGNIGEILCADGKNGLIVQTGDGLISIEEIQARNAKRMNIAAYLNGRSITVGEYFR